MHRSGVSRLYVLIAAVLFSTGGAAIKLASLSSWQIAGFRSGIAALFLWSCLPAWRRWWEPRALAVGISYAATMILYVTANRLTTAANAIFLQATAPLYVIAVGPWLLRERSRGRDVAVLLVLGLGLAFFFVGSEPPLRTAPDPWGGNLLAAASAVTWAFTLLGLRCLARDPPAADRDPTGAAVVAGNVMVFLFCLPLALPVIRSGGADWVVVAWLGVVQIGLAYVCMVRGVRRVRAVEVSLLLLLEPVLNALWAWWIHEERPGAWSLAGCVLVLLALLSMAVRGNDGSEVG